MGKNKGDRIITAGMQFAGGDDKIVIYDEGTWSPAFDGSSTGTYSSTSSGVWTRVNDIMFIKGYCQNITEVISGSGEALIKTLPLDGENAFMNCGYVMMDGPTYSSTFNPCWLMPYVDDDDNVRFMAVREDSLADYVNVGIIDDGVTDIWISLIMKLQ